MVNEFIPVCNHPDYVISKEGQVRSLKSKRILRPKPNWRGKLSVWFGDCQLEVDRLMCETFEKCPDNDQFTEIIHLDNDEDNLSLDNLEWASPYEYDPDEVWKDVTGYEGYYKVSDKGRVRSLPRVCMNEGSNKSNRNIAHRLIPPFVTDNGYAEVSLSMSGHTRRLFVHRIVATAFIPNPENKCDVNHIDGNKQNNCLTNLEWATRKENVNHAISTGLMHPESSAAVAAASKGCRCVETGKVYSSRMEASRDTGIYDSNICWSIATGKPTKGLTFEEI